MVRIVFFCAEEKDRMMMVVGKKEVCDCFKLRHTIQIHISVCVAKQNLLLHDFTKISSSMLKARKPLQ